MKEAKEWDEKYILNLPVGEFDWLEIKGRRGLDLSLKNVRERDVKSNLSKALSAFANTGGGTLVFGLADPTTGWKVDDGGVSTRFKGGTREWLEDIIPTLTDFPLERFNVYMVLPNSEDTQIQEGRALFIVDVGDSESAPHQASDSCYYARVGGKSRPIGHRLVLDIANRGKDPLFKVEFEIQWEKRSSFSPLGQETVKPFLSMMATNEGDVMAEYFNCFVFIPAQLSPYAVDVEDSIEIEGSVYVSRFTSNQRDNGQVLKSASAFWFEPILPGRHTSETFGLNEEVFSTNEKLPPIRWKIHADNAPASRGSTELVNIPVLNTKGSAV